MLDIRKGNLRSNLGMIPLSKKYVCFGSPIDGKWDSYESSQCLKTERNWLTSSFRANKESHDCKINETFVLWCNHLICKHWIRRYMLFFSPYNVILHKYISYMAKRLWHEKVENLFYKALSSNFRNEISEIQYFLNFYACFRVYVKTSCRCSSVKCRPIFNTWV